MPYLYSVVYVNSHIVSDLPGITLVLDYSVLDFEERRSYATVIII